MYLWRQLDWCCCRYCCYCCWYRYLQIRAIIHRVQSMCSIWFRSLSIWAKHINAWKIHIHTSQKGEKKAISSWFELGYVYTIGRSSNIGRLFGRKQTVFLMILVNYLSKIFQYWKFCQSCNRTRVCSLGVFWYNWTLTYNLCFK